MSTINFQQKTLKEIKPFQNKHISQSNKFLHHKQISLPSKNKKQREKSTNLFTLSKQKIEVSRHQVLPPKHQTPRHWVTGIKCFPIFLITSAGYHGFGVWFLLQVLPMDGSIKQQSPLLQSMMIGGDYIPAFLLGMAYVQGRTLSFFWRA